MTVVMGRVGPQVRDCGECTLCCTAMAVPELDKANGIKCEHECGNCGIYAERPTSCASFECLWLQGVGPIAMRPDKTGAVLVSEIDKIKGEAVVMYMDPERPDPKQNNYLHGMILACLDSDVHIVVVDGTNDQTIYEGRTPR
tara:strand:+ start:1716 stop:2141 length:426 start_codon:yes stop_codon:yes gene_type:complete